MEDTENKQLTENELIDKCRKFLERVSSRYSKEITEQEDALEIAGGKFWNEANKKRWAVYDEADPEGSLIPLLSYNNISAQVNAIASPFSKSPFHTNILNKEQTPGLQDKITKFEGSNIAKNTYNRAFTRAVTCSAGYVVIGTNIENGAVVPDLQFASNQSMVAIDPDCTTPDCSDAEEGAIVSYIPVKKARRIYGEDVIPHDYPKTQPRLTFANCKVWADMSDKVQVARYFVKDTMTCPETGEKRPIVKMYTICGDKVVSRNKKDVIEPVIIPSAYIPIVRFAGYNDYSRTYGLIYTGYVQKMMPSIEMMSLAMTQQATRMRRCSSVRYMGPADAINGCEGYFKDFEKGSSMGLFWNPKSQGVTLVNDTFQTSDITAVMQDARSNMQDISGVSLQGIQPADRTAAEVMTQQMNNESNVQELYLNAEAACNTISKIVLSIMNKGNVPAFTLEGGPSVITAQMKERTEIQAIQTMVPPEQQMLLAIRMAGTIDSDVGKSLEQDLKANCGLQLSEGKDVGGMMNICKQMQQLVDQTMEQLEQSNAERAELQKQCEALEKQLNDQKRQQQIDVLKWLSEMKAKEAQLQVDNAQAAEKLRQEDTKIQIEAMDSLSKNEQQNRQINAQALMENAKMRTEAMKLRNDIMKAETEREKIDAQARLEQARMQNELHREAIRSNTLNFNPEGV